MNLIAKEWGNFRVLLRSVPATIVSVFILSVVCMNLMAGKELFRSEYFCINCGLALSWISFLCMDCICKHFGAVASIQISMFAMLVNLLTAVVFALLCLTPGHWSVYYSASDPETAQLINAGVNATFGSSWYVIVGSAAAMLVSGIVNALLNQIVGKAADRGNYRGFAIRSMVSTCIAQWVDNFVFSALVSHVFFGWSWAQVLICSTTSMVIELLAEAVFSPLGYRICQRWKREKIGLPYLELAGSNP